MILSYSNDKSIVFIGFMGAGKTTIGELLAQKLNRGFIDVDEEIEKEYNMPVSEIFNKIGEKAFREKEKSFITNLSAEPQKIISLGGGAFLQEEIRKVCLSSCIVIYLDISLECWKNRLNQIIDSRPVLQGKSMKEMEELFYSRLEIYSQHHLKIHTDKKDANLIVEEIIQKLKVEFAINV